MTRTEIEAMDRAKVNCFLGKRVMGWKVDADKNEWILPDGSHRRAEDYDPWSSLDDAMEAAGKVGLEITEENNDGRYAGLFMLKWAGGQWQAGWYVHPDYGFMHTGVAHRDEPPALAVSRAVISAHEARNGKGR